MGYHIKTQDVNFTYYRPNSFIESPISYETALKESLKYLGKRPENRRPCLADLSSSHTSFQGAP
jgi:hypothetical protein